MEQEGDIYEDPALEADRRARWAEEEEEAEAARILEVREEQLLRGAASQFGDLKPSKTMQILLDVDVHAELARLAKMRGVTATSSIRARWVTAWELACLQTECSAPEEREGGLSCSRGDSRRRARVLTAVTSAKPCRRLRPVHRQIPLL